MPCEQRLPGGIGDIRVQSSRFRFIPSTGLPTGRLDGQGVVWVQFRQESPDVSQTLREKDRVGIPRQRLPLESTCDLWVAAFAAGSLSTFSMTEIHPAAMTLAPIGFRRSDASPKRLNRKHATRDARRIGGVVPCCRESSCLNLQNPTPQQILYPVLWRVLQWEKCSSVLPALSSSRT